MGDEFDMCNTSLSPSPNPFFNFGEESFIGWHAEVSLDDIGEYDSVKLTFALTQTLPNSVVGSGEIADEPSAWTTRHESGC